MAFEKLKLGISSCLIGELVRYNGQHKRDNYIINVLGQFASWIPVCPEVEVGMGVPREPIRLVDEDGDIRVKTTKTQRDYTDALAKYSTKRCLALATELLDGYILKAKSPTCGMERVKVYKGNGVRKDGVGAFAKVLMATMPELPVEEEGRLNDPRLRENFISRCYAYHRWQEMAAEGLSRHRLVKFHQAHKFALMAHNQAGYRRLGRIVANPKEYSDTAAWARAYLLEFTEVMRRPPTQRNHTNVLQHIAGYLPKDLDAADRKEVTELIKQYHNGLVPLIVPITLLRHHARKFDVEYIRDQVYLTPHPGEMMLLNRV